MWLATSEIISLSSGTDLPNLGIKSLNLHGYANLRKRMHKPFMPVATVPFLQTNVSGMARTFTNRGNSASRKFSLAFFVLDASQVKAIVRQVGKGRIFLFYRFEKDRKLDFIDDILHEHKCQSILCGLSAKHFHN